MAGRKKKFEALYEEFGKPLIDRALDVLGLDAAPAEVRAAANRMAGSRANAPKKASATKTVAKQAAPKAPAKKAAPAAISRRSGSKGALAEDILQEAAKPSQGSPSFAVWREKNPEMGTLFDLSRLSEVPDRPQFQIPRYEAPRGPSPRIVEALDNPDTVEGINATVRRGIEGGGRDWYNTDPLLARMQETMPAAEPQYAQLMDLMAATSPRARVPDNVRTGSYYNYLRSQGLPIPDKPAPGYGSIAQNLHRENVEKLVDRGGWDIYANPKPASFSSNLQGNQQVATIDRHNFRLPGILSKDPRFLEASIAELAPPGATLDSAKALLARQYPGLPEEALDLAVKRKPGGDKISITYRPQEWVGKGYIDMDTAVNDAGLWTTKPRDNEYGFYEAWQQKQAADMGISPAQYQASMWLGGGETTGLGSAAEPFLGTLEARVRYTADRLAMSPDEVLDLMVKGEIPLLKKGGRVKKPLAVRRAAS